MTREELFRKFENDEDFELERAEDVSFDYGDDGRLRAYRKSEEAKRQKKRWSATIRYIRIITSADRGVPKHSLYLLRKKQIKGWVRNVLRDTSNDVPTGAPAVPLPANTGSRDRKSTRVNIYIRVR